MCLKETWHELDEARREEERRKRQEQDGRPGAPVVEEMPELEPVEDPALVPAR